MILLFMDISVPTWVLFFPIIFPIVFYWLLKNLIRPAVDQNEVLDFDGNTTITDYRTHAFWVAILFIIVFFFLLFGLFFLMSSIVGLVGNTLFFLFPFLIILGYGFYNVVMMIKYKEPRDYKYWIGYVVISFYTSFIFLWLSALLGS